jgi:Zn-finger nucleic acid-binding protein
MVCAVYGAFAVDECRDCAGIWFDRSEFAPMIEKFRDGKRAALGPDSVYGSKRAPLSESQVRYLPCPRCGDLMARFNYAVSSGVILDRCGKDGVWMDAGELERIVDFLGTSAPSPLPQTPPASASRPTFEPPRRPSGFSLESFLDLIFYGS